MKKLLLIILSTSLLITSLSTSYYFLFYLPQKDAKQNALLKEIKKDISQNKYEAKKIRDNIETTDNNLKNALEAIEQQESDFARENQMKNDCEANNDGRYQGNGLCIYY